MSEIKFHDESRDGFLIRDAFAAATVHLGVLYDLSKNTFDGKYLINYYLIMPALLCAPIMPITTEKTEMYPGNKIVKSQFLIINVAFNYS